VKYETPVTEKGIFLSEKELNFSYFFDCLLFLAKFALREERGRKPAANGAPALNTNGI